MIMTATLVDVKLQFEDGGTALTQVGVVEGGFQDWMVDSNLDCTVYFFFDDLAEIEVGAELGDGTTIVEIYDQPYIREEFIAEAA